MRKTLLMCSVLFAATFVARADDVQMPESEPAAAAAPASLPAKGTSMKAVAKQYGAPSTKHRAAGGDTRRHPPITRWDYPGFSVFFERSKLIDAVVPGEPPPLHNAEELTAN